MASATDSSLLSKLESSDSTGVYPLFSDYLRPFSDLTNSKKSKQHSLIRPLAKKFLPFLNRALSILPKRLSDPQKLNDQFALQLFDVYRLSLDCLESLSSQLSCKPYSVHVQRVRMVHCMETAGQYSEAEAEGFRILESFKGMDFGVRKSAKQEGKLVPDVVNGGDDKEFVLLVVEVVVTLVKCAALGKMKDDDVYRRVLVLAEEVRPWFRLLDANAYEKLHRVLVTYLGKCTLFLVGELACFDGKLVRTLCYASLSEYAISSLKDQIYKFGRRICSSIFSLQEDISSLIMDISICVLDSIALQCKFETENTGIEYVELVSYCANKCRTTSTNLCITMATHLDKIAGDSRQVRPPFGMIMRLYAAGLHLVSSDLKARGGHLISPGEAKNDESAIRILLDEGNILQNVAALLGCCGSYFCNGCKEYCMTSSADYADLVSQSCSHLSSGYEACMPCTQKNEKAYLFVYLNALRFICHPLAELVNSERKQLINPTEGAFLTTKLCIIQDAFYQFGDIFLSYQSRTYESERDGFDENTKVVLSVAAAAFTLSIRTKLDMKRSMHLVKNIITSEWIQPQGLKHLVATFNNIGVLLYRNKQVKEASEALKLCCKASWTCVKHLCDSFVEKSTGLAGDLSESAILEVVNGSCERTAFLLDVLHRCDNHKLKKTMAESLEHWSVAGKVFERLPGPVLLVKQWVKLECKHCTNADVDSAQTLYFLLSSSVKESKRTIGIILEQELLAYEEMSPLYQEFCQKMLWNIIGILLQDVYVAPDCCLQKSRILVKKARALRVSGIEGLKDCIQCLSDSISMINKVYGEECSSGIPACHQLAATYCLRALCTQEAEPNSKKIFQDISAALNLWSSIAIPDNCSADGPCFLVPENIVLLLYNVFDLLSVKGCTDFNHDIYRLMTRLFKWKNVPPENCLATLWECRRTTHALCVSPLNEELIVNLSEYYGERSVSLAFWMHCLKGSLPLIVSFQQSFSFFFSNTQGSSNHKSSFRSDITVGEVKEAVFELISSAPVPSRSVFVAGYLYYDLCERLISSGRLIEALSYAKEAHRLRTKLFQEKFTYTVEQQTERYTGSGEIIQKLTYGLKNLEIHRSVASEIWSFDTVPWDSEGLFLSPWNVLQCYLESTLQVGIIHERIGNGAEAETFLIWGKNISCSQSLPLFMVAFSSVLGKVYRKKRHWDLAEEELQSAKKILTNTNGTFSCMKCRLMLEATVDQHLGDLSRSTFNSTAEDISLERFSHTENLYKLALDKLNFSVWKNCVSCPEKENAESMIHKTTLAKDGERGASDKSAHFVGTEQETRKFTRAVQKSKAEAKKSRNNATRPLLKEKCLISENNSRITRSRYRSNQNQLGSTSDEAQVGVSRCLKGDNVSDCSDMLCHGELLQETKNSMVGFGCQVKCICDKMRCWQCLVMEVIESGLVNNYIHLKWEYFRRRLSLRLLTCIGKCFGNRGQIHETHKVFFQSISVLVSRNAFGDTNSVPLTSLLDFAGKEISGDAFNVERAVILYNMCWFSLKSYRSKDTRTTCCDLFNINLSKLVTWLMLSFVHCREVPLLFQKVSKLLAMVYVLSASTELFPSLSSCKALSETYWASYFHQASLGTHLNYQFFSNMTGRCKDQQLVDAEGSYVAGSTCRGGETTNVPRFAPDSIEELEEFVSKFFLGLPGMTMVCISLLGGAYASLLNDLLLYPTCVGAWMLVSRFNSKSQPVVLLLPVDPVIEESSDDDADSGCAKICKSTSEHWHCPWGSTVVDDVAPVFKQILEDNYLSSSVFPIEDTRRNRTLWWMWRKKLDRRLGKLLRNLEDLWLGPWRCVLLGEWSDCKHLELVHKKLVQDLKSRCKLEVHESLLKVILGGFNCTFEGEACILQLCLRRGCFVGRVGHCDEAKCGTFCKASNGVCKQSELAFKLIQDAVKELEGEDFGNRGPIILVLDSQVQMLPWENLPILRNQEVYRMPSVGSISAALDRSHHHQEQVGKIVASFPMIDPLDAFYLLNPSGDLSSTQVEFERWFRDQNLEGKAGSAPTAEELVVALKSHDLFIYFGHGSGAQYIPRHEIQKLENCAATLLMGCSSGSLTLNGSYIPQGTPLSYLLAGSPVIVANLWEVTDKDIDRFGKAVLDAWLRERSSCTIGCPQCDSVVEEFKAMTVRAGRGNARRKAQTKKSPEACETSSFKDFCDHRPKIGSFMSQAREACTLPFLIGASPVCYGIPTGIRRKND